MMRTLVCALGLTLGLAACSQSAKLVKAKQNRDQSTLVAALKAEQPWLVEDAARYLGDIKARGAKGPLIAVLKGKQGGYQGRIQAAISLSRMGIAEAVAPMAGALERADEPEERFWLVVALGRFCSTESKGAVQQAAEDNNIMVARAARKAMAECAKLEGKGGDQQ